MTLQKSELEFVTLRHRKDLGVFIGILETVLVKKRLIFRNKYSRRYRYFWRPTRLLANKNHFEYLERGNNRMPFINVWYEIRSDIYSPSFIYGFPDIDRIHLYHLKRINKKTTLHNELMKDFSLNIFK